MRIVVFGDSIAQGFDDAEMGGWVNRLAQYAIQKTTESDAYDTSVFNLGISADTTEDLKIRMQVELEARLDGREGAVVLAIGVNDSQCSLDTKENKVSIETFSSNIESFIEFAKQYTEKIFVLGLLAVDDTKLWPMPWKANRGYKQEFVDQYNQNLKQIAAERRIVFIDVGDLFKNDLEKFLPDGIHPSADGHRLVFERVKKVLEGASLI